MPRAGFPPDGAAVEIAAEHGVVLGEQRSRAFDQEDFQRFDHILVMEYDHLHFVQYLQRSAQSSGGRAALSLLMAFAGDAKVEEVVDPYRRAKRHYLLAYEYIDRAVNGLVVALQAELGTS